ncbi:citryl-CoA lyase [Betaproteobacteria bacterium SCGC AG-212-J23]|nr:citryl-CoA lyase [Betaproteobacteria bacterium SCGC AG-212-J23]
MARKQKPIKSELAWSTPDKIVVRGKDLANEILGHLNLGDMAFLMILGRVPDKNESKLFNAMAVTLVEHGITPSAIATRMTYLGAPESPQAAVAAGLLGLGSVFVGSMEGVAKMLSENADIESMKRVPGLGHPIHKPVDPRSVRLFEIARETGFYGKYCRRIEEIGKQKKLVVNATGAIGALACELGIDWRAVRGIGVMARAIGLVGHILEEAKQPMALELWERAEDEASEQQRPKR